MHSFVYNVRITWNEQKMRDEGFYQSLSLKGKWNGLLLDHLIYNEGSRLKYLVWLEFRISFFLKLEG